MTKNHKKSPTNKLTVTVHYNDLIELNRLISMMRKTVVGGSICRHEDFGDGSYSMIVENMSPDQLFQDFSYCEEPDFDTIRGRVENIQGKQCEVFVSRMNSLPE